ncbi:MAG: NAD(P)-dependent oxidoreductase [Kofleriaceae bacterium]|nr:NAD(P)-dependent oxidoreductase [Kofleriaceae bacterium]
MPRIAFLGLGAMGRRMAQRLVEAGHDVVVWSRSGVPADAASLAGRAARSPRHAADGADVVLSMVTDNAASEAVWEDAAGGALRSLDAGALAIESSTLSPARVATLARHVAKTGASFLDAPVVGSRPAAESGSLVFLVGGGADVVERARPVLAAMGSAIHHVGSTPAGAITKLLANALFGVQVAALAELVSCASDTGVDVPRTFEAIGALPVASPALKGALASMLAERFDPMFPITLVAKDFGYAIALASEQSAMPLTRTTEAVFRDAQRRGLGDANITGVVRLYTDRRQA